MSESAPINDEKPLATVEKVQSETVEYPSNKKRVVVMLAIYLAVFLVTLDQNIISTAIPQITDEFHSLNDVGWYSTAYILTLCSFQLIMGKVYKFYPVKPIFLAECFLFEVGSALCGAAPNSKSFIVGRAISGLGAAGMFSGGMVIMFLVLPLHQRPMYQGFFGAVFALGSVIGPLIGGTFTDKVTWRWCFYINLPIGAVSMLVTLLILHVPPQKLDKPAKGVVGKINQLDPIGNLAFFPGIICLVLALQWGGTTYSWGNARIIVLLTLCVLLCSLFIGIQIWKGEAATVPPRIAKQRSIAAAVWFGFFNGSAMMIAMYYLPIWFQAVRGVSAIRSGIMLLPMILSTVFAVILSGGIISRVGYYVPFFYVSSIIMPIGAGLLSTLTPSAGTGKWVGYQIIFGIGLGCGAQQPLTVGQTVLGRRDVASGTALILFMRFLGSAIFVPVAQNIFVHDLASSLSSLPGIDAAAVIGGGATELRNLASGADLQILITDYNKAVIDVFYVMVATAAVTIFGTVFIEWVSVKDKSKEQAGSKGEKPPAAAGDV